jgi:hypothetical protein
VSVLLGVEELPVTFSAVMLSLLIVEAGSAGGASFDRRVAARGCGVSRRAGALDSPGIRR